mmetsp:Transcript_70176/g.215020  ORF Transcript_70176/g.215020 Transcript_70176/m.215020 type:complete len:246 (+) Transcript_70176:955-1692(+)
MDASLLPTRPMAACLDNLAFCRSSSNFFRSCSARLYTNISRTCALHANQTNCLVSKFSRCLTFHMSFQVSNKAFKVSRPAPFMRSRAFRFACSFASTMTCFARAFSASEAFDALASRTCCAHARKRMRVSTATCCSDCLPMPMIALAMHFAFNSLLACCCSILCASRCLWRLASSQIRCQAEKHTDKAVRLLSPIMHLRKRSIFSCSRASFNFSCFWMRKKECHALSTFFALASTRKNAQRRENF